VVPFIPVIIGGRVLQMATPRAIELIRMGIAKMLPPGARTVGSQSAATGASGPFTSGFTTNLPSAFARPGLMGKGLAGAAGMGSVVAGGPGSFEGVRGRAFGELQASPSRPMMMDAPPIDARYSGYGGQDSPREILAARNIPNELVPPIPPSGVDPRQAPMPPSRPREYSSTPPITSAPPMGPSSRELWETYNQSENPADFVRADRAMMEGRASGGRAPSGKQDSVSKALEIIHHLIMRG